MGDDLSLYFWALWGYARWFLAGGPFFIDTIIKRVSPDLSAKIDKWVKPSVRVRIELSLLFLALFSAGFLAWKDEHRARLSAEGRPTSNRHLTDIEKADLKKNFVGHTADIPVLGICAVSIVEAERYAYDFVRLFRDEMHFNVVYSSGCVPTKDEDRGIMIGVADPENMSAAAKIFSQSMLKSGIRIKQTYYEIPKGASPDYDLFIGEQDNSP